MVLYHKRSKLSTYNTRYNNILSLSAILGNIFSRIFDHIRRIPHARFSHLPTDKTYGMQMRPFLGKRSGPGSPRNSAAAAPLSRLYPTRKRSVSILYRSRITVPHWKE